MIPVEIDPTRVMVGLVVIGFAFFMLGWAIGRRPPSGFIGGPYRGFERQLIAAFTAMEELMVSNTQRLMDKITATDSKLDGYVVVVSHQTDVLQAALDALKAIKDEPTTAAVDAVIADLETHIAASDAAVQKLGDTKETPDPVQPAQPAGT